MKEYSVIHYKSPIMKWFFAFLILFGLGGYSNYTSPKSKDVATELVVSVQKSDKNTSSYTDLLKNKGNSGIAYPDKSLTKLMLYHTKLFHTKFKIYSVFISPLNRIHKTSTYTTSYTDEEDSFHFRLG